jgi:hypothetical protein
MKIKLVLGGLLLSVLVAFAYEGRYCGEKTDPCHVYNHDPNDVMCAKTTYIACRKCYDGGLGFCKSPIVPTCRQYQSLGWSGNYPCECTYVFPEEQATNECDYWL